MTQSTTDHASGRCGTEDWSPEGQNSEMAETTRSFDLSQEQLELAVATLEPGCRAESRLHQLNGTVIKRRGHGSLRFVDLAVEGSVSTIGTLQLIVTQQDVPLESGAVVHAVGHLGRARSSKTMAAGQPSLYCTALELLQEAPPKEPEPPKNTQQKRKASAKTVHRRSSSKRQSRQNQMAAAVLADRIFADPANASHLMHAEGVCSPCGAPAIDWALVPPSLDPAASGQPGGIQTVGAGADGRAQRKRWQVESVYSAMWPIVAALHKREARRVNIVDFGSGSGNATLAIAWLLREISQWVLIDAKPQAIELANKRVALADLTGIVETRVDRIEAHKEPFDIGVAVHACGAATDYAQLQCLQRGVPFVLVPCCVGKIARDGALRDLLGQPAQATALTAVGEGQAVPRSKWLAGQIDSTEWGVVVSVAGHSAHGATEAVGEEETEATAVRRKTKTLVEADRNAAALEYGTDGLDGGSNGYRTVLGKLEPLTASPMNDILVGWPLNIDI